MPLMWVSGHSPGCKAANRHMQDIPIDRVRPLALWLGRECGTITAACVISGVPRGTFDVLCYSRSRRGVNPKTAAKIVAAVLAVRSRRHPDAPHFPRLPTDYERELAPDPRTERDRLYQRNYRKQRERRTA